MPPAPPHLPRAARPAVGWSRVGLLLVALHGSAPAAAAEGPAGAPTRAAEAERERLDEELRRLFQRTTWDGVELAYARLLALQSAGVAPLPAQHELAADAALQQGDVAAARERLLRARDGGGEVDRLEARIADLDVRFGRVDLTVGPKRLRAMPPVPSVAPFGADERAAIAFAARALAESGRFVGMLPRGSYLVAGVDLQVKNDGSTSTVVLEGAPARAALEAARAAP
jgi:hypothetical protein